MLEMLSGDVKCGQWIDVWTHELADSHQKQVMARALFVFADTARTTVVKQDSYASCHLYLSCIGAKNTCVDDSLKKCSYLANL